MLQHSTELANPWHVTRDTPLKKPLALCEDKPNAPPYWIKEAAEDSTKSESLALITSQQNLYTRLEIAWNYNYHSAVI